MQTGDLILCCGRAFTSNLIKFGIKDNYSHVAIAVRVKGRSILDSSDRSEHGEEQIYVLDFGPKSRYCHFFQKKTKGLSLSSLEELKKSYERIDYCRLKDGQVLGEDVSRFLSKNRDKRFDAHPSNFLAPFLNIPIGKERNPGFTCVYMADYFYNSVGIYLPYRTISPYSFRMSRIFEEPAGIYLNPSPYSIFMFPILLLLFILFIAAMLLYYARRK